ncbi:hypothetical protein PVAP13_2NG292106 [Panicum virgatum]|uniref:Uncharacterized protein n=1 Tax=Panicum virgatum TaxID=38727 RepID=A0A8T0VI59_PANVG|nr:hypothetical protein PVAP13_2NG292106 [Panicum virgatum]
MSPRGRVATGTESNGTRVLAASGGGRGGRRPIPARHAPTWRGPLPRGPPFESNRAAFCRVGMFNQKSTATPPAGRRCRRAGWDGRVSRRTGARIASPDPVTGAPVVASSIARVAQLPLATSSGFEPAGVTCRGPAEHRRRRVGRAEPRCRVRGRSGCGGPQTPRAPPRAPFSLGRGDFKKGDPRRGSLLSTLLSVAVFFREALLQPAGGG